MSPRYFQGRSVTGTVTASTARSFSEVVDVFRICPVLGITRSAFLALDKRRRNEIKQVPFFVPACFRDDPSKRLYAEATHANLIFLDLDETREGKCPAAPFTRNPDSLYTALSGFNFAAHTTASSTPEKPRMRIVVDAEAIPLPAYAKAVATIGLLLGLTSITTESKVSVQPMFLPTMFSDSTEEEHPLIAHRTDARAFTVADIADNVPDEFSEPQQASQRTIANSHEADALFFLRAPVPEITLAVAKDALHTIDPDCSYHEWLEVAAALRHQFSPHKAEEAYTLFDEWSAQGSKYASGDETRAKWDSLRPTPVGRMPVTIRSLMHRAVQSGWDDKKPKDSIFSRLTQWMDDAETLTELMENGVHKILAAPLLSAIQEDMLVHHLCVTGKKRFGHPLSPTAVRKDMSRLKAEMKATERAAQKTKEPLWAKGVCYISAAHEFYRHRTGERYKTESFNAAYARHLLPTEDQLKEMNLPITPATLATPAVQPSVYALNHLKIATVYDYAYDPSQPMEMFFVNRGRKYVNTYSPTYPEVDAENAERAGELLLRHLSFLIAEPEYRRTLIDFMAFMVQSPGRKIRWAILLQSVEGAGKTYLAEVMKCVLGAEHVKTISGDSIRSGFNEWAFGHQLIALEEVRVTGSSRHEIMNALKPLITNDDIAVNQKFRDQREVNNITNYMMFSNHHDALALTPGDRRYFVVKSPLQSKAQVLALGPDYFPPLYAVLRDHPGAMRAWLMNWEISPDFCPDGHAPRTRYVTDLINDSASELTAAVRRALLEGDHPLVQYDILSATALRDLIINDDNLRVTPQQLAQVLREEGLHQIGRHLFGEERHYLWVRQGVNGNAPELAAQRLKENQKNLCMELFFT